MTPEKNNHLAVIDLGKTQKKLLIFSPELEMLHKDATSVEEKEEEGILADNIPDTAEWIIETLKKLAKEYPIGAISATTHGATAVYLDGKGEPVFPVPSYMNRPDDRIRQKFLEAFGTPEDLYMRTGAPLYETILNIGYGIFWLREAFPEKWSEVEDILVLPQYISFLLSGRKTIEMTTAGCHTMLWDMRKNTWSHLVEKTGIRDMFPEKILDPWSLAGNIKPQLAESTGIAQDCKVAVGIHDSNASLLPYLVTVREDFVLASTGTWCAFLCPRSEFHPDPADLPKNTLYYVGPFRKPVRASIFMAGAEHDHYTGLIREKLGVDPMPFGFDGEITDRILQEKDCFVLPTLNKGAGLFPDSKGRIVNEEKFFADPKYAYHVLCLSLAIQSHYAVRQAEGRKDRNTSVFIEGGFRNNSVYTRLMAGIMPGREVFSTNIEEATSYGAAICAKCCAEGISPDQLEKGSVKIEKHRIPAPSLNLQAFSDYMEKFVDLCSDVEQPGR